MIAASPQISLKISPTNYLHDDNLLYLSMYTSA